MWRDGIFPKDPDLKQFLTSGPAILAALQIQNAFDMNAAHKRDAGIKVQVAGCGAEPHFGGSKIMPTGATGAPQSHAGTLRDATP